MRIAIIGAGSAGLAALKNCSELKNEDGSSYTIKCFEKTDKIGGTWIYTPQTGVDRSKIFEYPAEIVKRLGEKNNLQINSPYRKFLIF